MRFIYFLAVILFFKSFSFGLSLSGFKISKDNERADITFCNIFEIKNISYFETKNKYGSVLMPVDISPNKKKYSNIAISSKDIFDKFILSFKARKEYKNKNFCFPKLKAVSSRKLSSSFRIANVDIEFDKELIVTLGLLKYDDFNGKNISPYKVSYPDSFKINSKKLKSRIEKLVVSEGVKAADEKKYDLQK